jgi:hypothetical protein
MKVASMVVWMVEPMAALMAGLKASKLAAL